MPHILVAGLGNPGPTYERTRHNAGFLALDRFAEIRGLSFSLQKGGDCAVSQGRSRNTIFLLIKPLAYMNRSGIAVSRILRYHRIEPAGLLVVHDDLDLPLGHIKFARGGGTGGHKGIRSIVEMIGQNNFPRLKLGIGRPPVPIAVEDYVLSPFTDREKPVLDKVLELAAEGILCFLEEGIDQAMNRFNGLRAAAEEAS